LPEFAISTKVGYFPRPGGSEHSLASRRLGEALERTAADLGRVPDLVFLHNPERSLARIAAAEGRARFAEACATLAEAVTAGLCASWGVASWDPRPLDALLRDDPSGASPAPAVLMTRAGLLVGYNILRASESLAALFRLPVQARWGMSPFGGDTADPIWRTVNTRALVPACGEHTALQAAFRVAYCLPEVSRVAVGTSRPDHLRDLADATALDVDQDAIRCYRQLLRASAGAGRSHEPAGAAGQQAISAGSGHR